MKGRGKKREAIKEGGEGKREGKRKVTFEKQHQQHPGGILRDRQGLEQG